MNEESTYEQIEAFLAGELRGEALQAFEERLSADADFRQEVELHRQLADATGGEQFHAFRAVLKETDAAWQPNQNKAQGGKVRILSNWQLGLIAAGFILLFSMIWLLLNPQAPSPEDLFATHFQPYEMVLTQRSTQADRPEALDAAIAAYANEQYDEAEKLFQQLAESAPDQPIYQLYACVSALAENRNEAAISCFEKLHANPKLTEQAQWYLGLAHLQRNDPEAAKAAFLEIREGTYQFDAAQEILEAL